MLATVLRMFALLALMLMPIGMAPVAAAPAGHEIAASPVTAGHCDQNQQAPEAPAAAKVHCTGCAALAAPLAPAEVAELRPQAPTHIRLSYFGTAFEPEIATPPPKFA